MQLRKIWKFPVQMPSMGEFQFIWPIGAKIIHVDDQSGNPLMWVELAPSRPTTRTRTFRTFLTGDEVPNDFIHVATVLADDDRFVWHLYEKRED